MKRYERKNKLEYRELEELGISEEAIEANYSNSSFYYFWTNDEHTEIGEADHSGYPTGGVWDKNTFKVWFNEIEGKY